MLLCAVLDRSRSLLPGGPGSRGGQGQPKAVWPGKGHGDHSDGLLFVVVLKLCALAPARPGENGEGLCAEERGGREGRLKPSGAFEKSLLRPLPCLAETEAPSPFFRVGGLRSGQSAFPNELLRALKGEKGKGQGGSRSCWAPSGPSPSTHRRFIPKPNLAAPRKNGRRFFPAMETSFSDRE